MLLPESLIAERLKAAYQPGTIASTDGYAGMDDDPGLRCAAVLIALVWKEDAWELVFTRRTETVENHKGQVSFPGGACDPGEISEQTALREAGEEIGIRAEDVRLLGRLNDIVTITHYRVTPLVGVLPWPYVFHPEPGEVARIFTMPLSWLAERGNWHAQPFTPDGAARPFPVIIYHPYDGEVLWGASARMTHIFLETLGLSAP